VAALATIALLDDPRSGLGGPWHAEVERWTGAKIRKIVRRARGSAWTKVQSVDGVTVELPRGPVPGAAAVPLQARAFVPCPIDKVPRPVGRLQIQSSPLEEQTSVTTIEDGMAGLLVAITPEVTMSWGKRAAQCAHAAQRAWETAPTQRRAGWDDAGRPLQVVHPKPALWHRLVADADIQIRDGGYTEIPAGTLTAVARWLEPRPIGER
jgi:peptidyl-tRNA hydrolase